MALHTQSKSSSNFTRRVGFSAVLLFFVALVSIEARAVSYVYVAKDLDTVSVIATATNTEIASVRVGQGPTAIAVTPNGAFAYVANFTSQDVSVINTNTNTVIATVPLGQTPGGIAITPDSAFAYVTLVASVAVIDVASNTIVANIAASTTGDIAISPNGNFAYVLGDNLSIIDIHTNTVVGTVFTGDAVLHMAISPDGAFLYLSEQGHNGNLLVVDTAIRSLVGKIVLNHEGPAPAMTVSPDGHILYVALDSSILLIDTSSRTVVGAIATPALVGPFSELAVTPDGAFIYGAAPLGPVLVIDTLSHRVVDLLLGFETLAITPDRPCGEDISNKLLVSKSGFSQFLIPQLQLQFVTVGNGTLKPIKGPVTLVLNNLTNAVFLNNTLQTKCYSAGGSPYVTVSAGADNVLSPGEFVTFSLAFLKTGSGNITYTQRVVSSVPTK